MVPLRLLKYQKYFITIKSLANLKKSVLNQKFVNPGAAGCDQMVTNMLNLGITHLKFNIFFENYYHRWSRPYISSHPSQKKSEKFQKNFKFFYSIDYFSFSKFLRLIFRFVTI